MARHCWFRAAAAALLAVLVLTPPAVALAEPSVVDSYDLIYQDNDWSLPGAYDFGVGQSFQPAQDAMLDQADFYAYRIGPASGTIRAELFEADENGQVLSTTPVAVSTNTIPGADVPEGSGQFARVSFRFDDTYLLEDGKWYIVAARYLGGGSDDSVRFATETMGSFAHPGSLWGVFTPEPGFVEFPEMELVFYVYGVAPPAPVVTTASSGGWSLALAGAVGLVLLARRIKPFAMP